MDAAWVSTIATAFTALVEILAIWYSHKSSLVAMHASFLNDFRREFDELRTARLVASRHAFGRLTADGMRRIELQDFPPEVWQVLDFFDRLSMYLKRGYLDYEMAFISFLYWMIPYWKCFEQDATNMRNANPLAMWHEIPRQIAKLEGVCSKLDLSLVNIQQSKSCSNIREFLQIESVECATSGGRSASSDGER